MKTVICKNAAKRFNVLRGEMSISELADKSEVSRSTVDALLNRRVDNVNLDTVERLCDGLGISIQDFFDDPVFDK